MAFSLSEFLSYSDAKGKCFPPAILLSFPELILADSITPIWQGNFAASIFQRPWSLWSVLAPRLNFNKSRPTVLHDEHANNGLTVCSVASSFCEPVRISIPEQRIPATSDSELAGDTVRDLGVIPDTVSAARMILQFCHQFRRESIATIRVSDCPRLIRLRQIRVSVLSTPTDTAALET
jgi:hypothetical protein